MFYAKGSPVKKQFALTTSEKLLKNLSFIFFLFSVLRYDTD